MPPPPRTIAPGYLRPSQHLFGDTSEGTEGEGVVPVLMSDIGNDGGGGGTAGCGRELAWLYGTVGANGVHQG